MSLRDVSMVYVLGEDAGHRSFIRAWLNANGVHARRVFVVEPPAGKSGGSTFVLDRCRQTIEDARRRNRIVAQTRVLVAIDADDETLETRLSQIARCLEGSEAAGDRDIAFILIPKRHIETWAEALNPSSPAVNESADYKPKTTDDFKQAARHLAALTSEPAAPPSLVHGYRELQRLKVI